MIAAWMLIIMVLLITIADIVTFFRTRNRLKKDHEFHLMEDGMKKWLEIKRMIDKLPYLLERYHQDKSKDVKSELENFFRELGQEGFKKEFLNMLKKLRYPYYIDFLEILKSLGIEPRPAFIFGKEGFVVEWEENDTLSTFWIGISEEWSSMLRDPIESIYYWLYAQYELEGLDLEQIMPTPDTKSQWC